MKKIDKAWGAGVLAALLCSCGADADSEPAHTNDAGTQAEGQRTDADGGVVRYVGEVQDADIRVAILTSATQARLFFCGGETNVASDTHWFNLSRDGATLQSQQGEFGLNAHIESAAVSGEYRVGTQRYTFTSRKLGSDTLSGLYEGSGDCGRLGLILSQSAAGAEILAQGACVGDGHPPEQVNPILPIASQNGSIPVRAPGQEDTLLLEAAGISPL
jgi:hypothetical protein